MLIQPRKLVLEFTKMSGTGNDFIVIDNRFYHFSPQELSGMAKKLCPRRLGAGADGLLALGNATTDGADYRMSYYNADGSLGTMCGNGARCLARYARDAGIVSEPLLFDSDAGLYKASVGEDRSIVRLFVPSPKHFSANFRLKLGSVRDSLATHYIWTGTEHLVVQVQDVASLDVDTEGRKLRNDDALQPHGANINFSEVLSDGSLSVRTFEKGVEEETLACGTGSIACALVSRMTDATAASPVVVRMPGGDLTVGWEGSALSPEKVFLEGEVEVLYRATTEI